MICDPRLTMAWVTGVTVLAATAGCLANHQTGLTVEVQNLSHESFNGTILVEFSVSGKIVLEFEDDVSVPARHDATILKRSNLEGIGVLRIRVSSPTMLSVEQAYDNWGVGSGPSHFRIDVRSDGVEIHGVMP